MNSAENSHLPESNNDCLAQQHPVVDKKSVLPKSFLGSTGSGPKDRVTLQEISCSSTIDQILDFARTQQTTDVHLSTGQPVCFRVFNQLISQTKDTLSLKQTLQAVDHLLSEDQKNFFESNGDFECIYVLQGSGRFRVTMMKKREGYDITIRLIPLRIPTPQQLLLPDFCLDLLKWNQGMVLVTGPTGCGKTTTLSSLVQVINQQRKDHIITIENPVEIVFQPKQSQISQREINLHTLSQDAAIRAALREDPDVLVISELRDLSTIQLAATAAETGHLVLGTMNTNDAIQTILRIINAFSPDEQSIVRNMISESLKGIICQQLVPRKDGKGVVAVYEVLVVNQAVTNLIRKGNLEQLINIITTGRAEGMIPFDASLRHLFDQGMISGAEVFERCLDKKQFVNIKDD